MIPEKLSRILLYGAEKTKKTWWTGLAAELGFNVIHLCGDRQGWHIFNNLSPEAQNRITIIDAEDLFDAPHFASFFGWLLKGKPFWYHVKNHTCHPMPRSNEEDYFYIDVSKLTKNDIVVTDSWTALARSVMLTTAKKMSIDLFDAEKEDWEFYGFEGRQLDAVLSALGSLSSHLVVIGHEMLREKKDEKQKKTLWTKWQPISSSGPHGGKLGAGFTDILYFIMAGKNYYIDTSAEQGRVGGCRNLPPMKEEWDKLSFERYCSLANIDLPGEENEPQTAFEYKEAGTFEMPSMEKPKLTIQSGGSAKLETKKPTSLTALIGKK